MRYVIHHNVTRTALGGWQPCDSVVRGYIGEVEPRTTDTGQIDAEGTLDRVFLLHNADDRPDGRTAWSLSVGDVVVLGETAWACERRGWKPVSLPADSVVGAIEAPDTIWSFV